MITIKRVTSFSLVIQICKYQYLKILIVKLMAYEEVLEKVIRDHEGHIIIRSYY